MSSSKVARAVNQQQEARPRDKQLKRMLTGFLKTPEAIGHPLMEGYLYKQSHVFDVFNKRYFVLYPQYLVYYEKESDFKGDETKARLAVSP